MIIKVPCSPHVTRCKMKKKNNKQKKNELILFKIKIWKESGPFDKEKRGRKISGLSDWMRDDRWEYEKRIHS